MLCYNWPMSCYYFLLSQPLKRSRYLQGTWEFQPKQRDEGVAAFILDAVISVFSNIFSGRYPGQQGSQLSPMFSDNLNMYEIPARTTENKECQKKAKINTAQVNPNPSRIRDVGENNRYFYVQFHIKLLQERNWLLLKFTPAVCKRYNLFKCEKFTTGFPPLISIPPPHLRCKCSALQGCSSEKTRTSWSCVILIMCSIQRNCMFSN